MGWLDCGLDGLWVNGSNYHPYYRLNWNEFMDKSIA